MPQVKTYHHVTSDVGGEKGDGTERLYGYNENKTPSDFYGTIAKYIGVIANTNDLVQIADNIKTAPHIADIATLRALGSGSYVPAIYWVNGYYGAGTEGGGPFRYDSLDTTTADDGFSCIMDANNRRWKRTFIHPTIFPQDAGAKGSATEDTAAFQAIQAYVGIQGGGHVQIPNLGYDYTLGDGTTAGTAIEPPSNTVWEFCGGAKIIHQARTVNIPDHGNSSPVCIRLNGVSNVAIIRPYIDGGGAVLRRAITWEGEGGNIHIYDANIVDCLDFHFSVLDWLNNDRKCAFDGIYIKGWKSSGTISTASQAIEIFPKKGVDGVPACRNLALFDIDVDVSNGSSVSTDHAANAIKFQNVKGVRGDNITLRGGTVCALDIISGAQDVHLGKVVTKCTPCGVLISNGISVTVMQTQDIRVDSIYFDKDGLSDIAIPTALQTNGAIPRLSVGYVNTKSGSITINASPCVFLQVTGDDPLGLHNINETGPDKITGGTSGLQANVIGCDTGLIGIDRLAVEGWTVGETLTSSNTGLTFTLTGVIETDQLVDPYIGPTHVSGTAILQFAGLTLGTTVKGPERMHWGPIFMDMDGSSVTGNNFRARTTNEFLPNNSTFGPFYLNKTGISALDLKGVGNHILGVTDVNGYDNSSSTIVTDAGTDTKIDFIRSQNGGASSRRYGLRKTGGSGLRLGALEGVYGAGQIVDFTGQDSSVLPIGNRSIVSPVLDLTGVSVDTPVFVCSSPTVILGVEIVYLGATAAVPTATIRVGRYNGGTLTNTYALSATAKASAAVNTSETYINVSGTRSFTHRILAAGDVLTVGTSGGDLGKAIVKVSLIELTS